jgi:hypothetical protein
MERASRHSYLGLLASLCVSLIAAPAAAGAGEPAPEVSKDGLHLVKQTSQRLVYVKPGATFSQYNRVAILDCYVEFQKDWQREYNSEATGLNNRVTDSDIQRMKDAIAKEFRRVFTDVLQKNGGYQVVDTAAPDVLVLRPAIINVQVTAPDLMTAGMQQTVVRSAGQATLYLEVWDSASNTLLGRVLDAQADKTPYARVANRVTNAQAADLILTAWAEDLRQHLDAARAAPKSQ